MGLIDTGASRIAALALEEQVASPAANPIRWLLHTLPGGLYIESPAGVVTGPFTATGGTPSFTSLTLTGTGGAGYLSLPEQSAAPTFAANHVLLYTDASNRPAWIGENNKTVAFDATANTANAIYTLPPATDTLVGLTATQTLTNKTLTSPALSNPGITGVASIADGLVGTPSLAFTSDPNTGIYSAGADEIGLTAGGAVILRAKLFSSTVHVFTVGDGTGSAQFNYQAAAGNERSIFFYSGATSRWKLYVDSTAESGSNAGSNFALDSRNDAGSALISNVLFANRATGNIGLQTGVPTNILSLGGNAARTFWMERHTTSNNAGNSLTVQAGGATSAATDKAGGALVLLPGLGTGSGIPGLVQIRGDAASPTTGTADHSLVDRHIPNAYKVLTNNSAITIVNATAATLLSLGGVIHYLIEVTNGTDVQAEVGYIEFVGVNKGGAFTVSITEVSSHQVASSGTLATTWAISSANPAAVSVNANSSLTPSTGYPRITYSIQNFAQQAIAVA